MTLHCATENPLLGRRLTNHCATPKNEILINHAKSLAERKRKKNIRRLIFESDKNIISFHAVTQHAENNFYNSKITSKIEWKDFYTLLILECAKKKHKHKWGFRFVNFTFAFYCFLDLWVLTSEESKSFIMVTCSYSCYVSPRSQLNEVVKLSKLEFVVSWHLELLEIEFR